MSTQSFNSNGELISPSKFMSPNVDTLKRKSKAKRLSSTLNLVNPASPHDFSQDDSSLGSSCTASPVKDESSASASASTSTSPRPVFNRETTPANQISSAVGSSNPSSSIVSLGVRGILRPSGTPGSGNGVRFGQKNRFRVITPNNSQSEYPNTPPRTNTLFASLLSVVPISSPLRFASPAAPASQRQNISWEIPGEEGEVSLLSASASVGDRSLGDEREEEGEEDEEELAMPETPWSGVPEVHSSPLALPTGDSSKDISIQDLSAPVYLASPRLDASQGRQPNNHRQYQPDTPSHINISAGTSANVNADASTDSAALWTMPGLANGQQVGDVSNLLSTSFGGMDGMEGSTMGMSGISGVGMGVNDRNGSNCSIEEVWDESVSVLSILEDDDNPTIRRRLSTPHEQIRGQIAEETSGGDVMSDGSDPNPFRTTQSQALVTNKSAFETGPSPRLRVRIERDNASSSPSPPAANRSAGRVDVDAKAHANASSPPSLPGTSPSSSSSLSSPSVRRAKSFGGGIMPKSHSHAQAHAPSPLRFTSIFADMSLEQAEHNWPLQSVSKPVIGGLGGSPLEPSSAHSPIPDAAKQPSSHPTGTPGKDQRTATLTPSTPTADQTAYYDATSFFTPCPSRATGTGTGTATGTGSRKSIDPAIGSTSTGTALHNISSLLVPTKAVFEAHSTHSLALETQVEMYRRLAVQLQSEVEERDRALVDVKVRLVESELRAVSGGASASSATESGSGSGSRSGDIDVGDPAAGVQSESRSMTAGSRRRRERLSQSPTRVDNRENESKDEVISELRAQLDEARSLLDAQKAATLSATSTSATASASVSASAQAQIQDLEIRLHKSLSDNQGTERRLSDALRRADAADNTCARWKAEVEEMMRVQRDGEVLLVEARRAAGVERAACVDMERMCNELKVALGQAQHESRAAGKERDRARQERQNVDVEMGRLNEQIKELSAALEAARADARRLRAESANKDLEISTLSRRKAELKEDREMLNVALDSKQQEVELLKRKLSRAQTTSLSTPLPAPLGSSTRANINLYPDTITRTPAPRRAVAVAVAAKGVLAGSVVKNPVQGRSRLNVSEMTTGQQHVDILGPTPNPARQKKLSEVADTEEAGELEQGHDEERREGRERIERMGIENAPLPPQTPLVENGKSTRHGVQLYASTRAKDRVLRRPANVGYAIGV